MAEQTEFPSFSPHTLCFSPQLSWWTLLNSLQQINIFLAPGSPKLDVVLHIWCHKCQMEGRITVPGGYTHVNTPQDAVGCLCCKGTLLVHIQLVLQQDTRVLLCRDTHSQRSYLAPLLALAAAEHLLSSLHSYTSGQYLCIPPMSLFPSSVYIRFLSEFSQELHVHLFLPSVLAWHSVH